MRKRILSVASRATNYATGKTFSVNNVCRLSTATETGTDVRLEAHVADSFLQVGSRPIFDYSHDQYRELCRRFYKENVIPYHDEWETKGMVPRELWKQGKYIKLIVALLSTIN